MAIILQNGQGGLLGAQIDARFRPLFIEDEPLDKAGPFRVSFDKLLQSCSLQPAGASGTGAKIGDPDHFFEGRIRDCGPEAGTVHIQVFAKEGGHGVAYLCRDGALGGVAS